MAKSSSDLGRRPQFTAGRELPELPVTSVSGRLMTESGPALELMARTNPRLIQAANVGFIYSQTLGSTYVSGRIEQMLRMSVSMNGQGRRDLIDALDAGGSVPDAYYSPGGRKGSDYRYIREDDE